MGLIISANIKGFMTNVQRAEREMGRVGKKMQDIGGSLSTAVTLPLLGLGAAAVGSSMKMESLRKGLTAVSGSADAADKQFQSLKEVAKLPGLGLEEAVQGSVNLQAAGFSAEQAENALKGFGNALATVGKGKAELDGVILALGQIKSKGKISAEEINQLAERVPQIRKVMQDAFGTAVPEDLQKLGISAEVFVEKVSSELLKLPQVTGGLGNAWENLGDATKVSLGKIGDTIANAFNLEGVFNSVAEGLQSVAEWFENLSPSAQTAVAGIGIVLAAIGPLITGIGFFATNVVPAFISGLSAMKAALAAAAGPIGLIVTAVAALGYGIYTATSNTDALVSAQEDFAEITRKIEASVQGEATKISALIKVAQAETATKEDRKKVLNELNKISPEYFGNLNEETIKTSQATDASNRYIESLKAQAKARAVQGKLDEIAKERLFYEERLAIYMEKTKNAGESYAEQRQQDITALSVPLNDLLKQEEFYMQQVQATTQAVVESTPAVVTHTETFAKASTVMQDLASELKKIDTQYRVFGDSVDVIKEKQDAYTGAIKKLIDEGAGPASAKIAALKDELLKLDDQVRTANEKRNSESGIGAITPLEGSFGSEEPEGLAIGGGAQAQMLDDLNTNTDALTDKNNKLRDTYTQLGSTIGGVFAQALTDTKGFAENGVQIMVSAVGEIIKALLAQAIAGYIANNIATLGPLGIALAATAVPVVGGLFDSLVPKLAEGGITTGPTLAMIGDNPSGKELVLPLEKAKSFFGQNGAQDIRVYGVLKGNDIMLSNDRAVRANQRNGGRR